MKTFKILIILIAAAFSLKANAQTADEKVGAMMNSGQWFELREFYDGEHETVSPFLDVFARAMVAHFFNKPDSAVANCRTLLNSYSAELGLGNLLSVTNIASTNLGMIGENSSAASLLRQIISATKEHLDSTAVASLETMARTHELLAKYQVYDMSKCPKDGKISFRLDSIGKPGKRSVAIMFNDCNINGNACEAQFDTGAGVNVISDSLAAAMGLDIYDLNLSATGIQAQSARLGVAKELRLGDATLHNVPFYVMTISSGNAEADKYLNHTKLVLGIEVMNALRTVTIDFPRRTVSFSKASNVPADAKPNLCFGGTRTLQVHGKTLSGQTIIVCPDTGNGSFGSVYPMMKESLASLIDASKPTESIRMAGAGGWQEVKTQTINNLPLTIANKTVTIPAIPLFETGGRDTDQGNLGIESLMLFQRLTFDLNKMILWTE